MTHWSIYALKSLFASKTLAPKCFHKLTCKAFEYRPTKFILEFEIISIRIFSYLFSSSHHFLLTYHLTWSRNEDSLKCLAIIHLWSVGLNRENWDCLKNVSAGVLTIFILYHVSQALAFAVPPLHQELFLQPWKLQALKAGHFLLLQLPKKLFSLWNSQNQ